jgi:glyoxylase-like metal-dependent hydrolase (beta-lactamase superfamily II)
MVDRFYRGRAVVDAAVRAVGGAQALRGLTAIEYEVYGEVSNDVQGYSAARIGNPAHDGGIRIINRFDISGARFYQRVEQSYDSGYDSAFATVWRGGVQYSPRWVSRDYTETEGAPSPFSAGGPFMVASRWMPPLILQRALQNFRAAAWVGESSTADGPADVVEVSFDEATRFRIHVARSNAMVRRVEAVAPDPLAADDVSVAELSGEQTVSGIVFPVQSRALRRGAPTQVLRLRGVVVNPALSELDFAPPEGFSRLENTTQVRATQIAGRVYEVSGLAGGTYQAPFVVMDDFVVAYEAPLGVAQTRQVIAEIRRIAGDKPIRYVVISHFHADHAGGVYVEAGATILSSAENEAVLRAYAAFNRPQFQGQEGPRTDLEMRFQAVPEAGYEIVDGAGSRLRILDLANNTHVEHMLGLFDPDTGVFMGADHYIEAVLWNPTFERTARWVRENPQVTTILGTHVRPVTRAEFLRIAAERRDEPRRGRLHWEGLRRR